MSARALDHQAILEFATEVRRDLGRQPQRELHSKYLYDDIGSALFEAITLLPEYGLTRADERLLRRHAPEIARLIDPPVTVAELGSGGGRKTRPILEALAWRGCVSYYPIDVSPAALQYVNRLSDFLFVASRYANDKGARDVLWAPGQNR